MQAGLQIHFHEDTEFSPEIAQGQELYSGNPEKKSRATRRGSCSYMDPPHRVIYRDALG